MQMIDVLKRLAELDSSNAQVENKLATVESLMTVSNGADSPVNECGGMGMMAGPSHSPASINMTANSGEELSNMLKSIVSLAGIDKGDDSHQEIDLGTPHVIEPSSNDNMASTIDLITKMDDEGDKADDDSLNFKKVSDAEEGMFGTAAGGEMTADEENETMYDNSPDPEIEPHDYGDKQVTPKPQGLKQRKPDNPYTPYKPTRESVDSLADRLLSEFHEFISESDSPKKKVEEVEEGILHKGAAWLAKKLSAFAGTKALKPGTYIVPPLERMGGKPISFSVDSESNVPRLNLSGAERNEFALGRLYKHIEAHIQSGNYEVAPSAMQRDYSQKSMPKPRPPKDEEVDEGLGKALLGGAALIEETNVAVSELTKGARWRYTELGRKSVDDLASKATDADSRDGANKLFNKALKRQANVRKVEKDLVGGMNEWDEDPGEEDARRAEALEASIEHHARELGIDIYEPKSEEESWKIAQAIEGTDSTLDAREIMDWLEGRGLIRGGESSVHESLEDILRLALGETKTPSAGLSKEKE